MLPLFLLACSPDYAVVERHDTAEEVYADSFYQELAGESVDVLISYDTSGSMTDTERERTRTELLYFVARLESDSWRVAMTSTDPEYAATNEYDVFPGYLTTADSIYDIWGMQWQVEEESGDKEEGFAAAYAYIEGNPHAVEWFRPDDAALHVIIISDEEEQSGMISTEFAAWLRSTRDEVHLDVVVDPVYGQDYTNAASELGGSSIDINASNWNLDELAEVEMRDKLALTYAPDVDTLRVFYGDTEQTSGWWYEDDRQRVRFNEEPPGGTWVTAAYVIATF